MNKFFRFKTVLAVFFVVFFALAVAVPGASAAYTIKHKVFGFKGTAGEALSIGDVVAIADADGLVYKADANVTTLRPAVGVIGTGGAIGAAVEIITDGIISGYTTLSEGQYGYLSETAGAIIQVAPTYAQPLGVAINATEYLFSCRNYFDATSLAVLGVLTGAAPLILEGATADAYETTIAPTDPTADRTVTLPDASGTVVLSTLATNAPDAANSVTGASNGLVFEGATADAFETTIVPTDPTADRTITIPDKSVTLASTILVVTADANGKTVAAAEAGDINTMGGAGVWALPEASTCIGCIFDFAVTAAGNADINPADGDVILGLTNAAGDAIRCATAGSSIRLIILDATNIAAFGPSCIGGTWADVN